MARSRRDLAILARIGAKFRNPTLTDPHHNVSGLGKVADLAPGMLGIAALPQASISATSLREPLSCRMAGSRRDLVILPRIGAKFRNSTLTDPYHDVSDLGKVADFAPSIFETAALLQVSI